MPYHQLIRDAYYKGAKRFVITKGYWKVLITTPFFGR